MSDKEALYAKSWNAVLAAKPDDFDEHILPDAITGEVPKALRGGRLLSNGPGHLYYEDGNLRLHPFDGHGYMRSFAFNNDGSVNVRARFVETNAYHVDKKNKTVSSKGLGTNPGDRFWSNVGNTIQRNVANTTVYRWGDRLIAGWEGGEPHSMDPVTLKTHGLETFGDLVTGQRTLAHMRHDHEDDTLLVVNVAIGKQTELKIHEFDSNSKVVNSRKSAIPHTAFVHDFVFTKNWVAFGGNAISVKPFQLVKYLLGGTTFINCLTTNTSKPGEMILVPRRSDDPPRRVKLPKPLFAVHFTNAFEKDDGTVIVDACVFHDFNFGVEFGYTGRHTPFDPTLNHGDPQRLLRITIPPGSDTGTWEQLATHAVDFPRVRPSEYGKDAAYMTGASREDESAGDPFDSVLRVDLKDPEHPSQLWTAPDNVFVGEPIIVHEEGSDSDYLVVILSDGLQKATVVAVFDAGDITKGPICSIPMRLLPYGFHGEWDPVGVPNPVELSKI